MMGRIKPTKEDKLELAVKIAEQVSAAGETVTLTTLRKRCKTDGASIRKRLFELGLEHVIGAP